MSDDTPVTLSQEGGRQLSPEMWAAVQEELHDFLEEGKVTITPGGGLPKENPGPFSRKRKKQPKNNPPGTHMLVESTADVLVQVEETLQRAIIPGLRVGRAKYRQSDFVAQRIMSLAVADTASETAHKMSPYIGLSQIVNGNQGCQLSPETWAAVQEELHDLLEARQIIIEPGGRGKRQAPRGLFLGSVRSGQRITCRARICAFLALRMCSTKSNRSSNGQTSPSCV
ncbi:hypothetical protein HKI87_02g16620 [Chloropicon roscoffensis]|uniref:Uncharacterized protein n=1 Tax=Chloropicon roscoffensis TaxID=1461544 RepID=A0AAX4P1U2_9CHLO